MGLLLQFLVLLGVLGDGSESMLVGELRSQIDRELPQWVFVEVEGDAPVVGCPVIDHQFFCRLAAGRHDLRLLAEGYAPTYFWDLRAAEGESVRVGPVELHPGASISGWVEPSAATIELVPSMAETLETQGSADRLRRRTVESAPDERGFFQLRDLPAGTFDLKAVPPTGSGLAPLQVDRISLATGESLALGAPLSLPTKSRLQVYLDPPVDPYGEPWRVALGRFGRGYRVSAVDAPEAADQAGFWSVEVPDPGRYVLEVGTALGPRWIRDELTVEAGQGDLLRTIDIETVAVRGEVMTADGDAVRPATIWFGGRFGAEKVRMDTDGGGVFRGYLPREGEWPLEISTRQVAVALRLEPVEIELKPGDREVELRLELPDTRLRGLVVDDDEQALAGVPVQVVNSDVGRLEMQLLTDEEGRFEVEGLRPGGLMARAELGDMESTWVPVQLIESMEGPEIRLVVGRGREVVGRVMSSAGPVPGASLMLMPHSVGPAPSRSIRAATDHEGRFRVSAPAATQRLDLVVMAVGFSARILSLDLRSGEEDLELWVEPATAGGQLVLALGDRPVGSASLLRGSATSGLLILSEWSRLHGEYGRDQDLIRLPAMEAGDYQLCAFDEAGRTCRSGYLRPSGELELVLPEGRPSEELTRKD